MDIARKQLQHQENLEHTAREIAKLLDKQKVINELSRRQVGRKSEVLESLLHRQQIAELTRRLLNLHPADIAFVLESLPLEAREGLWQLIPARERAAVLMELSDQVRTSLLGHTSKEDIFAAISHMDTAELSELLPSLPKSLGLDLMARLDQNDRQKLQENLSFPKHSAGALMDLDMVTVRSDMKVAEVIIMLRSKKDILEINEQIYVISGDGLYQGTLTLKNILFGEPEQQIAEIMDSSGLYFFTDDDAADVASAFERYDLISVPVLNIHNHLVGNINVNRVVDFMNEQRELQHLKTVGLSEEEEIFTPAWQSARNRRLWLGLNLITAFIASRVIGAFEDTITQLIALATLMPIVASVGGNTGNQTVALMIRGLALKQINQENANVFFRKEITVGLINGLTWGFMVAVFAYVFYGSFSLSMVIFASIMMCLAVAAIAGTLIPYNLSQAGRDPVMGSSVMLTAVTDSMGFLIFLGMASLFLI